MGEAAEKLQPNESVLELPPLPKGDTELMGIVFPTQTRLGTSLMVGRNFNDFDVTGTVARIAVDANGNAYALVRTGGKPDTTGLKIIGGRYRRVIFFPSGMYGVVPEGK